MNKGALQGLSGSEWNETKLGKLPERFQPSHQPTHDALDDARAQAEMFEKLLAEVREGEWEHVERAGNTSARL